MGLPRFFQAVIDDQVSKGVLLQDIANACGMPRQRLYDLRNGHSGGQHYRLDNAEFRAVKKFCEVAAGQGEAAKTAANTASAK